MPLSGEEMFAKLNKWNRMEKIYVYINRHASNIIELPIMGFNESKCREKISRTYQNTSREIH
jgi:hypothetical protein